jgi:hypothetical protein
LIFSELDFVKGESFYQVLIFQVTNIASAKEIIQFWFAGEIIRAKVFF